MQYPARTLITDWYVKMTISPYPHPPIPNLVSFVISHTHAHTHASTLAHARTHARTHTHTRTHAHTHTHTQHNTHTTQHTHNTTQHNTTHSFTCINTTVYLTRVQVQQVVLASSLIRTTGPELQSNETETKTPTKKGGLHSATSEDKRPEAGQREQSIIHSAGNLKMCRFQGFLLLISGFLEFISAYLGGRLSIESRDQ